MHECAAAEREVRPGTVLAVLADRVVAGLAGGAVLQLGGRRRDAVDEKHEVEAVAGALVETDLPDDPKQIRAVELARGRIDLEVGFEIRELDGHALLGEALAEEMDRAVLVE